MHLTILFLHPRSSNLHYFLQQYIQGYVCRAGSVDVFQRNRKWFLSRNVQFNSGFNVMTIMNYPVIVQKSLLASSSSRVESTWCGVGECNSSDFLCRIACSSPGSGQSWVKVDVLRRCSHPKIWTVPSASVNMKFLLLCGVNASFALSLRAWSSDASISSKCFNVCDHNVSFPDSHRV